ncbi:serine acetyltransferase [Rhodopseudomonas sp. HC1]|uniref:serine O-acetyltransferase EpsC n=1 Tax=Rhodopseudomonas infernalis TaxID=2897386 RepID=UPI001EE84417|nr:serine O-acetyltransferase EpsC [Rhodopseudomonas infernalis]MCG6205969.1 serine acetyltransferase [Rhodopseudomonas infernalis]
MPQSAEPRIVSEPASDLGAIVAELAGLRAVSQRRRYRGRPLPDLPSREAVAGLVDGLVSALYPRHFGPAGLSEDGLDIYVADTIEQALTRLQREVGRELHLADLDGAAKPGEIEQQALTITTDFAHGLPRIRALLDSDIRAAFDGDPAAKSLDEVVFCYPGVAAMIRHRIAHQLYVLGVPMLARIVAEIAHAQTGIDIHPGATIGESFFIDHGTGVVIGETARIGKRVRLYQAVTLGAKRFETNEHGRIVKGGDRHPIIEDDVVIYAGATVLGRVTIGQGSQVGGGVWLTRSVPPGTVVTQAKPVADSFENGGGI